jgi:hypothetical protein
MSGSHAETMTATSSRSRDVRTVRSDSPVYRTRVAADGNAPGHPAPRVRQADQHELARARGRAAAIRRDRSKVHAQERVGQITRAAKSREATTSRLRPNV